MAEAIFTAETGAKIRARTYSRNAPHDRVSLFVDGTFVAEHACGEGYVIEDCDWLPAETLEVLEAGLRANASEVHLTPAPARPATCRRCARCSGPGGSCTDARCACHGREGAPESPDLEALAYQLERSRALGAGAFSFARLAFLAGIREAEKAARETAS